MMSWFSRRCQSLKRACFLTYRRVKNMDVELRMMCMMKDDVFTFPYGDLEIKMYLPYVGRDVIQTEIVSFGEFWELGLLERVRSYVRPGAVVLDCGANIGNHTLFFAKVCGAGKIHAFEPQAKCLEILARNVELNGLQSCVERHAVVLGAKSGRASVDRRRAGNVGATSFMESASGGYGLRTLDSYAFERVDFVKIDVEGAHYDLLLGARETLARCSPVVWVEMFSEQFGDDAYDCDRELNLPMKFFAENGYVLKTRLSDSDYLFVKNGR